MDNRRALFLERIARAWDKVPDLSFGRILVEALGMTRETVQFDLLVLRGIEDAHLAEAIERYVLTRANGEDEETTKP